MFEGLKNLFNSEKALVGGSLVVAATVLVALGHMTISDWQSYTQLIFLGYISGKTVQGAVSMWTGSKKSATVTSTTETPTGKTEEKVEVKGEPAVEVKP